LRSTLLYAVTKLEETVAQLVNKGSRTAAYKRYPLTEVDMSLPTYSEAVLKTPAIDRKPANLNVLLRSVNFLAEGISSFEFVGQNCGILPEFTAGSHIDVHLPGYIRQYSLCNDPSERYRYVVAVLRDEKGRGGSRAMHDQLRPGDKVVISPPRNHFELYSQASNYIFIAGGIGITPIMSMIAVARAQNKAFHLYYCTRSPERAAFLAQLKPLIERGHVTVHYDGGQPSNGLNLKKVLSTQLPGSHLYYCGPTGFMDAVAEASNGWIKGTVHSERFSAPLPTVATDEVETSFDINLARSGRSFTVAPGQTIVEVLAKNGINVDVSCKEGYCGTCMTRYLEGQPLHRDSVLDEEDREEFIMVCCSRAKSKSLVLDL
jgi:vanillate O-demethylase ferredoxin subunit